MITVINKHHHFRKIEDDIDSRNFVSLLITGIKIFPFLFIVFFIILTIKAGIIDLFEWF